MLGQIPTRGNKNRRATRAVKDQGSINQQAYLEHHVTAEQTIAEVNGKTIPSDAHPSGLDIH